jgi:hypothetical protein
MDEETVQEYEKMFALQERSNEALTCMVNRARLEYQGDYRGAKIPTELTKMAKTLASQKEEIKTNRRLFEEEQKKTEKRKKQIIDSFNRCLFSEETKKRLMERSTPGEL